MIGLAKAREEEVPMRPVPPSIACSAAGVLSAAVLIAALAAPLAAQPSAVPRVLVGTWALEGGAASAMRIVDAAFRPTISALPQILHGLARERIRANMTPANRVTLSIDGERVRVVLEAARTTVVSGALGAPARTSGVEAGTRVTPRLSSGWLELLYEGEGSELRQLFSAEPDGSRMHLDYTVSGPQLSRGPVRYRLEYVRR